MVTEKIDKMMELANVRECPIDENGRFKTGFKGIPGMQYFGHGDPSLKNDAFGFGIAHKENDTIIADLLWRFKPEKGKEIDVNQLSAFIEEVLNRFPGFKLFSSDSWAAASIQQMLKKRGVEYENLFVLKPQHDILKEQIYLGKVIVHSGIEILRDELKGLQLLNGRRVDHPSDGSKDVADTLAGLVWHCVTKIDVIGSSVSIEEAKEQEDEYGQKKEIDKTGGEYLWQSQRLLSRMGVSHRPMGNQTHLPLKVVD